MVKWGLPGVSNGLVLLTNGAPLDVVCHPLFHPRPLNVFARLSEGLIPSWVAGGRMVVIDGHQRTFLSSSRLGLNPVDRKLIFRNECHILVISFTVVCPWRAR